MLYSNWAWWYSAFAKVNVSYTTINESIKTYVDCITHDAYDYKKHMPLRQTSFGATLLDVFKKIQFRLLLAQTNINTFPYSITKYKRN